MKYFLKYSEKTNKMDFRKKGLKLLNKYMNDKKSKHIEEKIFEKVKEEDDIEISYNNKLYFYLSLIKNKQEFDIDLDIWDCEIFNDVRNIQKEKDEFISNPFIVEEGVLKCDKCGSNRTYSYSKQVRSADEGFTTFVTCAQCNAKWRIN